MEKVVCDICKDETLYPDVIDSMDDIVRDGWIGTQWTGLSRRWSELGTTLRYVKQGGTRWISFCWL